MKKKNIFLDIETTGLFHDKGDKIIEIFCLESINYKLTKRFFHVYLNPDRKISNKNYSIHGISNKFLLKKPRFKEIVYKFLNFIKNSFLIIHNANFDLSFINKELDILKIKHVKYHCLKIIDTLKLARIRFPSKRNSLLFLCKRFNINTNNLKLHSAMSDCILLFKIYKYLNIRERKIFFFENNEKKIFNKNFNLNNIIIKSKKKDEKLNKKFFI